MTNYLLEWAQIHRLHKFVCLFVCLCIYFIYYWSTYLSSILWKRVRERERESVRWGFIHLLPGSQLRLLSESQGMCDKLHSWNGLWSDSGDPRLTSLCLAQIPMLTAEKSRTQRLGKQQGEAMTHRRGRGITVSSQSTWCSSSKITTPKRVVFLLKGNNPN